MRERQLPSADLLRLAALQDGVITREQALGLALGRHSVDRLIGTGAWQRLASGIYLLGGEYGLVDGDRASGLVPNWTALAWAGVLIAGDEARLGGLAAAYLHRLTAKEPSEILILHGPDRRVTPRPPWIFVREQPGSRSTRSVGSPPRLGVEDTLLDLCTDASPGDIVTWISEALHHSRTTISRLNRALAGRRRMANRRLIEDMLSDVSDGVRSPLERHYLHDVEQAHGLPVGTRQQHVAGLPHQTDVLYEAYDLLVELDGHRGHEGAGRFRDMTRDNQHATTGRTTLRYGWWHVVDEPCRTAWQVSENLTIRGWSGLPARCSRCRLIAP